MNLVLIGFKNSGKSHFGRLLSRELSLPFIDTDDVILELAHFSSCKELHQKLGETAFREIEKKALISLQGIRPCIIATGGGAVYHDELKNLGKIVFLDAPFSLVKERGLPDWLEELFYERRTLYQRWAELTIDLHEKNEEEILVELKEIYGK